MRAKDAKAAPLQHAYKRVPIDSIRVRERNPRTHSPGQIEQLRAAIHEWGFTNPVLIDETGELIAGHGRLSAAQLEGLTHLPAIELRGLSDAQKRALVIADNQLAMNAEWDTSILAAELQAIDLEGFDLKLVGFDTGEIDRLLGRTGGHTDPDEAPPVEAVAVTRAGDVWLLGRHRIACGDATQSADVALALGGVAPHLMVTDPPYGVSYDPHWRAAAGVNKNTEKMGNVVNDDRADWREAWSLFPGDVAYVWHAGLFAGVVADSLKACDFTLRSQIIWSKDRFALGRGDYHWQHEPCWYAVRDGRKGHSNGDRSQATVWNINSRDDSGHGHSTQKPVECMKRPMENNSSPGQAVYDPFLGSGTTVIAAEMTGRSCLSLELHPLYVDVSVRRWQNFTQLQATLDGDGRSFDAVAAERLKPARKSAARTPAKRPGQARRSSAR